MADDYQSDDPSLRLAEQGCDEDEHFFAWLKNYMENNTNHQNDSALLCVFTSSFYRSFHATQNNNQSTSPIGKAFQNFESAEQIRWKSNNDVR